MTAAEVDKTLRHRIVVAGVPDRLVDGLALYIVEGIRPGHFLTAVLENDLTEAISRGDDDSRAGLVALVTFLYNYAPASCWGSPARVEGWEGLVQR